MSTKIIEAQNLRGGTYVVDGDDEYTVDSVHVDYVNQKVTVNYETAPEPIVYSLQQPLVVATAEDGF